MVYRDCECVADIVREAFNLIRWDSSRFAANEVTYCFRGENHNYERVGSNDVPRNPPRPGLYYEDGYVVHESDFFNEALRTYPDEFSRDKTTFEILTRMQHYGYPTRLMDVTPKLTTAIGIATVKSYDGDSYGDLNGFVHVYRVKRSRIKYGTSDTVTALSNLARIKKNHVTINDLEYLAYECQNERVGFFWDPSSDVSKELMRDIGKVWCVKPMVNNIRVNFQLGEFFLFGCKDGKSILDVTFSEDDYDNRSAATEGIARIGIFTLTPAVKKEASEMCEYLDIGEHRLYSDFRHHSEYLKNKFGKGE